MSSPRLGWLILVPLVVALSGCFTHADFEVRATNHTERSVHIDVNITGTLSGPLFNAAFDLAPNATKTEHAQFDVKREDEAISFRAHTFGSTVTGDENVAHSLKGLWIDLDADGLHIQKVVT